MRLEYYHFTLRISHLSKGKLVISLSSNCFSYRGPWVTLSLVSFHNFLSKRKATLSQKPKFALRGSHRGNSSRKPFLEGLELEDRS